MTPPPPLTARRRPTQDRDPRIWDPAAQKAGTRRRRAWVLLLAAPLSLFAAAYVLGGGRSGRPLILAAAGVAVVLAAVSLIARWSARQEAKEARR